MRFGQILATVGLLGEDETGHSLWDIEDTEFAAVLERFAADLARRGSDPGELAIGIGARVAPGPLPHNLACGSALGGSTLCSKLLPDD
jgi:hypothetical protein